MSPIGIHHKATGDGVWDGPAAKRPRIYEVINGSADGSAEIIHKSFQFDLKQATDIGQFSGIASISGIKDLGGDIMEPGAIQPAQNIKILWQHMAPEVIGLGNVTVSGANVVLDGNLDVPDDPVAVKALRKMRKGFVTGLSIGFQALRVIWEETEEQYSYIRHIVEAKLWEISIVTFPMLPEAQVQSVKQLDALESVMRELKEGRAISGARADRLRAVAQEIMEILSEAGASDEGTKTADPATYALQKLQQQFKENIKCPKLT